MENFFTAFFKRYTNKESAGSGSRLRSKVLLAAVCILFSMQARAQEPTFYESFDNTPMGEIPQEWKWYSLGGGGASNWVRSSYGLFGPRVMTSGTEYAIPGQIDEDWLVTPQITPAEGDYLIFDSGQEFVWTDLGSTFNILISTTGSNRADFTETLASFTEPEFPGYLYYDRLLLDLAAYKNQPIYIAFVHKNPVTGEGGDPDLPPPPMENWYLDNVWVRPVQQMDYSGGEIQGSYQSVVRVPYAKTTTIIGIIVRASGDTGSANISSLTFTTEGTSPNITITKATLYTTHGDSFIATDEENGIVWADEYGSVTDPGEEFTITGDLMLERGDTYFWLMYEVDVDESELTYPFPQLDATFETVVVNGVEHPTTVPTTQGSHAVVPLTPVNDNYADAIEILPSSLPARYGSYNYRATYESEFERLAYCATPVYESAMDGSNSVWWHFKAPRDGMITVDLSLCSFNTMLLIQDSNFDQLACNKDIDESSLIFQSKITDFEVESGKDYYIRVSGEGFYPGDPNAGSGVVHMDFSFFSPVGVEEDLPYEISKLYPNPADGTAYVDLFLRKPSEVSLDILDLLGRPVLSHREGFLSAGTHEHIPLDVSSLPSGTYMVRLKGSRKASARKLIVMKK